MKIAVVSGKGGAGKTSVAVSLILTKRAGVFVDADVEEPNGGILLSPQLTGKEHAYKSVPVVDESYCDFCKKCAEACQFNAIMVLPQKVIVFEKLCHSCGTCVFVCPKRAISENLRPIGEIEYGRRDSIEYIGGRLNIGEAMATPLIRQLKERIPPSEFVVIDAPPGVTCPMVETVKDADYVLVVAESSAFGFHDFTLVVEFLKERGVPFGVVENKKGLVDKELIYEFCQREGLNYIAYIPYKMEIARSYSQGIPLIEADEELRSLFVDILNRIEELASC